MREIKFRAWDADEKEMITYFSKDKIYQLLQTEEGNIFCGGTMRNKDWQEPKLMQYTGLKDKNGVEIYEGDIIKARVKNKEEIHQGEVKFNKSSWVVFDYNDGKIFMRRTSAYREYEVIGDIYQNPELL